MRHVVADADTAAVLGTVTCRCSRPRLITWMEGGDRGVRGTVPRTGGQTTAGTAMRIEHFRATPLGGTVEVVAKPPSSAAGRRLTFFVEAFGHSGEPVGAGEIERAIVDREAFLETTSPEADHRSTD